MAQDKDAAGEQGFLDRWSRRKMGEADPAIVEEPAVAEVVPQAEVDDRSDAEILEELGLRDPDEMQPGDDFSRFMQAEVPARLRNKALRKLWVSNPVLANLDELLDYGEDFTDAATVVENLQTAYKVGRGFIEPEDEKVEDKVEDEDAGEQPGDGDPIAEDVSETETLAAEPAAVSEQPQFVASAPIEPLSPERPGAEEELSQPARIGRMRFQFD